LAEIFSAAFNSAHLENPLPSGETGRGRENGYGKLPYFQSLSPPILALPHQMGKEYSGFRMDIRQEFSGKS
jgi:hypothetical protein